MQVVFSFSVSLWSLPTTLVPRLRRRRGWTWSLLSTPSVRVSHCCPPHPAVLGLGDVEEGAVMNSEEFLNSKQSSTSLPASRPNPAPATSRGIPAPAITNTIQRRSILLLFMHVWMPSTTNMAISTLTAPSPPSLFSKPAVLIHLGIWLDKVLL